MIVCRVLSLTMAGAMMHPDDFRGSPPGWKRPAHRMKPADAQRDWAEEYDALLRRAKAQAAAAPTAGERRGHPRFRVRGTIGVQLAAQVPGVDMSVDGVSFRSAMPIEAGKRLNVVLAQAFLSEVEVIACEEQPAPDASGWPWRVHCRFLHPGEGMRVLIVLDSMGILEPGPAS